MDLALHLRVIWRFKYLVAFGLILAAGLSLLALARISFVHGKPHLAYRKAEIWGGTAKLLITQQGLPWGRLSLPTTTTGTPSNSTSQVFADPSRLSGLASFYAQLANSDAIQRKLPLGAVRAAPVVDTSTPYSGVLPILQFTAIAPTPARANALADSAATIFQKYVVAQQTAAQIPQSQRVLLELLNRPAEPQLIQGRKKALAIVAFMTVLIATLGLAFILENLRPRAMTIAEVGDDAGVVDERLVAAHAQRTA